MASTSSQLDDPLLIKMRGRKSIDTSPPHDDRHPSGGAGSDGSGVGQDERSSCDRRSSGGSSRGLHWWAERGELEEVQLLLDQGHDVDLLDQSRFTPLHLAARHGHDELVEALLEEGADPHLAAENGWTAAHIAARYGHVYVLRHLLDCTHMQDHRGRTPLHLAAVSGCPHTLLLLLHSGADPAIVDACGQSAVHVACEKGHVAAVEMLLSWLVDGHDAAATATMPDHAGLTALHYAAMTGSVPLLSRFMEPKLGLQAHALNYLSPEGMSPLSLAVTLGHVPAAQLLVDYGAHVDQSVHEAVRHLADLYPADPQIHQLLVLLTWKASWFGQ